MQQVNDKPGVGAISSGQTLSMTTDPVEFEAKLKEGDLLLFDSLHLLSQFLKLADDRPVNHCAVYLGAGEVAQCNKPPPDEPDRAIGLTTLSELLGLIRVRTVTALRHEHVVAGKSPAPVVTRTRNFVGASAPYAYVDLARLAAPCLLRAYREQLVDDHASSVVALLRSATALVSVYDRATQARARLRSSTKVGMTCSSFAYRCFVDGTRSPGDEPFPVQLNAPLAFLDAPAVVRPAAPPAGTRPRTAAQSGQNIPDLRFHPALDDLAMAGTGVEARVSKANVVAATQRTTARRTVSDLVRTSRPAGQAVPPGSGRRCRDPS